MSQESQTKIQSGHAATPYQQAAVNVYILEQRKVHASY